MGPGCPTLGGPLRRHMTEGSSLGGQRLCLHLPDVITCAHGTLPAVLEELLAFPVNKGAFLPQRDPSGSVHQAGSRCPCKEGRGLDVSPGVPQIPSIPRREAVSVRVIFESWNLLYTRNCWACGSQEEVLVGVRLRPPPLLSAPSSLLPSSWSVGLLAHAQVLNCPWRVCLWPVLGRAVCWGR